MSLKPQRVNFDEKWTDLKETVQQVITMGNVQKNIWNDRFSYVYSLFHNLYYRFRVKIYFFFFFISEMFIRYV